MTSFKVLPRQFSSPLPAEGGHLGLVFDSDGKLFGVAELTNSGPIPPESLSRLKVLWARLRDTYHRGGGLASEVLARALKEFAVELRRLFPFPAAVHVAMFAAVEESLCLGAIGRGALLVLRQGALLVAAPASIDGGNTPPGGTGDAVWVKNVLLTSGDRVVALTPALAEVLRPPAFRGGVPWEDLGWVNQIKVPGAAGVLVDLPAAGPKTRPWSSLFGWARLGGGPRSAPRVYVGGGPRGGGLGWRRYFLGLIVVLAVAFLASTGWSLWRTRVRLRGEKVDYLLAEVSKGVEGARNLLDLDNTAVRDKVLVARESLEKAKVLGASTGQVRGLENELVDLERRALRINFVTSEVLYDVEKRVSGVTATGLALGDGELLTLDTAGSRVLRVTLEKNPRIESVRGELGSPTGLVYCDGKILTWSKTAAFLFASRGPDLQQLTFDPAWGVTDATCFGDSVYLLSSATNQILKGGLSIGAGSPRPWLKDRVDLSAASLLSIDGQVYIWFSGGGVGSAGSLRSFLRGREVDFSLRGPLTDPVGVPTALSTWDSAKGIYLLDGLKGRVLFYSKQGELLGQYWNEQWVGASALAISRDEKQGYVLGQGKIYVFSF